MKRLFGLLGLVYLSTTAVVFYFHGILTAAVIVGVSVVLVLTGLVCYRKCPKRRIHWSFILAGVAAMCALTGIFLFENNNVRPLVDQYSEKEISFTGYICEQPILSDNAIDYLIQTETINEQPVRAKLFWRTYDAIDLEAFDKITGSAEVSEETENNRKSRGIFLSVNTQSDCTVQPTGEKQVTPYVPAVAARQWMQSVINRHLYGNSVYLSRAMLLGDKQSLPFTIKQAFTRTGTSHLVVVSGMHFSVVLYGFVFLLRKLKKRWLRFIIMMPIILFYCALTGFYPSVVRAGIMLLMLFGGECIGRSNDSLNSLGLAAFCLTVCNPYVVGDVGMLLSFAATLGILLWANPILTYIRRVTGLDRLSHHVFDQWRKTSTVVNEKPRYRLRWSLAKAAVQIPNLILSVLAVSIAACAWTMPLSAIFFGRTALLAIPLSVVVEPLAAFIIWSSMLMVCFCFIPPLTFICAAFCGWCCRAMLGIISACADLPFANVRTDELYIYLWLAAVAVLVTVGFILRAQGKLHGVYIRYAVAFSFALLLIGYSVTALCADTQARLIVCSDGSGMTMAVAGERNLSLLSCGGSRKAYNNAVKQFGKNADSIDRIIIPKRNHSHARYLNYLEDEFDVNKVLVYDSEKKGEKVELDDDNVCFLDAYTTYHFTFNDEVTDAFFAQKNAAAQYLSAPACSVLYLTAQTDIGKLPPSWRSPDVLITEGVPKQLTLLHCRDLYFTGTGQIWERYRSQFSEVSRQVHFIRNQTLTLPLSAKQ